MGRRQKVHPVEILEYLGDEAPHSNKQIAIEFEVCAATARSYVHALRMDGHIILPTNDGQKLVVKVRTPEQAMEILNCMAWAAKLTTGTRAIAEMLTGALANAPKRIAQKAELQFAN